MNKTTVIAALVLILCQPAFAASMRVVKVKGNKAVVQLPPSMSAKKGDTIEIADGDSAGSSNHRAPSSGGGLANTIGFDGELSSLSRSNNGGSTTLFSLTGRYGWNTGDMEFGPLGIISRKSDESAGTVKRTVTTTMLLAGGFFDYNLVPNDGQTDFIYGLGAQAYFGQTSVDNSSGGASATAKTSTFGLEGGGFLKWFVFTPTTCLRADARLVYVKYSDDDDSINETGIRVTGGLQVYF